MCRSRVRLCGGSVGLGAGVVEVSPPLGANGFVQRGVAEQPLEVRRELLEPSLEVAAGAATSPGSPVLLVCVPIASRDRYELATQALGFRSHVGRPSARHRRTRSRA